ncbi:MAG: hypothetical protein ABI947_10715 [Chloroflexota bacterium]
MTLVVMTLGWICGIAFVSRYPQTDAVWPALVIGGLILAVVMRGKFGLQQLSLAILAAGLGMWRYSSIQPTFTENDLATYNNHGYADMVGIVMESPDVRDTSVRLRVEIQSIRQRGAKERTIHGLTLVTAQRIMLASDLAKCPQ